MTDRYQRLRDALAAGPTPGPWQVTPVGDGPTHLAVGNKDGLSLLTVTNEDEAKFAAIFDNDDAEYIAAASPDTIRALLDERDRLRAALADLYPIANEATRGRIYTAQRAGEVGAIFEAARATLGDTNV